MPVLKNTRHERFAQALSLGKTATEAHKSAGYKPDRGNATRLTANNSIRARVSELQGKIAAKAAVSVLSLTEELEQARSMAIIEKQTSAAVAATMGKAKLHGLIVEKRHHSGAVGTYDLSKVSDADLDRLESILGPIADTGGDPGGEEA